MKYGDLFMLSMFYLKFYLKNFSSIFTMQENRDFQCFATITSDFFFRYTEKVEISSCTFSISVTTLTGQDKHYHEFERHSSSLCHL